MSAEKGDGLLRKYEVRRVNDPTGKHDACRYFVLDPQHDPIAVQALMWYGAKARQAGYEALASDLFAWLDDLGHVEHDIPFEYGETR